MKKSFAFLFALFVYNLAQAAPNTPSRINFYEEAQSDNLNTNELELLKPIIDSLQAQYDQILSKVNENENNSVDDNDPQLKDQIMSVLQYFIDEDTILEAAFKYNTKLPSNTDLKGSLTTEVPSDEIQDMENILQENLNDAQETIRSLVDQSNETEAMLISINKIKILKYIYKLLGNVFSLAIRVSRAAYCTYSYIPIINSTLTEGRANIGSCYVYSRDSIKHLRNEVQSSIDEIRENVIELITVYKKISNRQSLLGKLFTLLMNVSKITDDINDSRSTANKTIEEVKTQAPIIAATTKECATNSIPSFVNQLNETITGLMTCINFVDDSTQGPEPEPESDEESSEEEDRYVPQNLFYMRM